MEPLDGNDDTVHPEVRAHINSLVSALGGVSADDDGKYQLGDDALEVLRDIKRWIRFYDEKTNRMDVARCIYEANLIEGDLLPVLALWPENSMDNKFRMRVSLACLEVMVPLTWPMDRGKEMTVNHHRHMPVLELAQVQYKKAIINFDGARILHAAVRTALPSMAIPIGDRTARDQGIIKLVLFFLRNVAMISQPPTATSEGDESQISRTATIDAFSYQDIFLFILTLASNMGEEFRTEDTTVMEIIYHLVKRVVVEKVFMNEQQLKSAKASELSALMQKESSMLKAYNRKGPTRHSRFGTMVWVQRDDGKMSSLSGQDALADAATRNQKMDSNKTFKPPRRARKEQDARDLGLPAKLNARANAQLRSFVEEFLDSGFNPLFQHVRKTIDREAPHLMQYHRRQFFHLVAWFLEAERVRRRSRKGASQQGDDDVGSFNLIAGVLNQEMFVTLNKALHESYEMKDWQELTAVMRCFTQILLTVQEMAESGREDDEEIAENVLSRLFYEESTHDAVVNIAKNYKDQGFDYLDAATELVHHFLRILEAYSKQNVEMQVRSRKRTRRSKLAANQAGNADAGAEEDDDSANDEASAERTTKERSFDFHRFASKFSPQGVVDTFAAWTKYYRDLSDGQLKRAHRYFYRLAFKQDMGVMLFRVDIIHLLYNMIKGPEPLDKSCKSFKEWEELVKQILRKCFKKIQERPELIVEMLFSKLHSTAFFLEYGYEKQTSTKKREAKPGAELEFRHTEERDKQVAIVVGAMLDRNESDHIKWVKDILTEVEKERRAWTAAQDVMPSLENGESSEDAEPKKPSLFYVRPDDSARRTAMFKNSYLRLLMTVSGFQRFGPVSEETLESSWVVPGEVSADELKDTLHFINQAEFSPPVFDDGASAEQQLKRKSVPRRKAAFDDDDEGLDDEALFPLGGPTDIRAIDRPAKPKKTRKRRRKDGDDEEPPDEAELDEKARKRREREREKARRIKSALYVNEGDDEFDSDEDEAFFARERAIAERARLAAASAEGHADAPAAKAPAKKRKSDAILAPSDDDEEDNVDDDGSDDDKEDDAASDASNTPESGAGTETDDDDDSSPEDGGSRTNRTRRAQRKRRRMGSQSSNSSAAAAAAADDDVPMLDAQEDPTAAAAAATAAATPAANDPVDEDEPVAVARRPRVRGGFILDSDDDDE